MSFDRFAALRRCTACGIGIIPDGPPRACPHCTAVSVVPPIHEWPEGMFEFLVQTYVQMLFVTMRESTEQQRMERLIRACFAGSQVGGRTIPYAATPDDIWPAAVAEFERWKAERTDSVTVAA